MFLRGKLWSCQPCRCNFPVSSVAGMWLQSAVLSLLPSETTDGYCFQWAFLSSLKVIYSSLGRASPCSSLKGLMGPSYLMLVHLILKEADWLNSAFPLHTSVQGRPTCPGTPVVHTYALMHARTHARTAQRDKEWKNGVAYRTKTKTEGGAQAPILLRLYPNTEHWDSQHINKQTSVNDSLTKVTYFRKAVNTLSPFPKRLPVRTGYTLHRNHRESTASTTHQQPLGSHMSLPVSHRNSCSRNTDIQIPIARGRYALWYQTSGMLMTGGGCEGWGGFRFKFPGEWRLLWPLGRLLYLQHAGSLAPSSTN